nr:acylneuraminate cytidylyltransferase [Nanoarchaeum sp.]
MKMKVLAIIPARGGSKGIPRKNIVSVNGKPLIYYSIDVAKKSELIERIIVSTDDNEIAEISKKYGAEVMMRPSELAQDKTPTFPVLKHVLEELKKENYQPDIIVLLEPTFPLRKPEEVDSAIQLLIQDKKADSVRAVIEPFQTPYKMWKLRDNYLKPFIEANSFTAGTPRQLLDKVYWQNGYIYVLKYDTIMKKGDLYGDNILPFILSSDKFLDVDTKEDIKLVEFMMKNETSN